MNLNPIRKAAYDKANIIHESLKPFYCFIKRANDNKAVCSSGRFCAVIPMCSGNSVHILSGDTRQSSSILQEAEIGLRLWFFDDMQHRAFLFAKDVALELTKYELPYFVKYQFLDHALRVDNKVIPGIKMDWVKGETLDNYIKHYKKDSDKLNQLVHNFFTMCKDLCEARISHGDLSHSNIMVTPEGNLILVDYDSLYLPSMASKKYKHITHGWAAYQHPNRFKSVAAVMSAKDDYFSQILIYLSLMAIAQKPDLIDKYILSQVNGVQYLLFEGKDLATSSAFKKSQAYKDISKIKNSDIQKCLKILVRVIDGPLDDVPSLIDVIPQPTIEKNLCPVCGTPYTTTCSNCGYPHIKKKCPTCGELYSEDKCPKCSKNMTAWPNPEGMNQISHDTTLSPDSGEKVKETCPNPKCQKQIILDAIFCPYCGEKVKEKCPVCNKFHKIGTEFCPTTGRKI